MMKRLEYRVFTVLTEAVNGWNWLRQRSDCQVKTMRLDGIKREDVCLRWLLMYFVEARAEISAQRSKEEQ